MNPLIIVAAISFFVGMFGYVLVYFWLRPVGGYLKVKRRVAKDLSTGLRYTEETSESSQQALIALRPVWKQHAAAVTKVYEEQLPDWYKLTLTRRGESPMDAAKHLLALANIHNPLHAAKRMAAIKACFKLK